MHGFFAQNRGKMIKFENVQREVVMQQAQSAQIKFFASILSEKSVHFSDVKLAAPMVLQVNQVSSLLRSRFFKHSSQTVRAINTNQKLLD